MTETEKSLSELKSDVKAGFAAVEEELKTLFNKLDDINNTLHGNGRPGLIERVNTLEEKQNGTGKTVSVIGQIGTFLLALYGAFFKHTS